MKNRNPYSALSRFIFKFATGKMVLIFFLLNLIMMILVMPGSQRYIQDAAGDVAVLDIHIPTYSVEEAHETIEALGDEGRHRYKLVELTADLIYPLIYSISYSLIIAYFLILLGTKNGLLKLLPILPIIAMIFDYCENGLFVNLINEYPNQPDNIAWLAGKFSLIKWIFAFAGVTAVIIPGIILLIRKFKKKSA